MGKQIRQSSARAIEHPIEFEVCGHAEWLVTRELPKPTEVPPREYASLSIETAAAAWLLQRVIDRGVPLPGQTMPLADAVFLWERVCRLGSLTLSAEELASFGETIEVAKRESARKGMLHVVHQVAHELTSPENITAESADVRVFLTWRLIAGGDRPHYACRMIDATVSPTGLRLPSRTR